MAVKVPARRRFHVGRRGAGPDAGRRRKGLPAPLTAPPGQPPRKPPVRGDSLEARIDGRIDERFDGETTKSSLAILLAGFAVLMAAIAGITIFLVAGGDDGDGSTVAAESATPTGFSGVTPDAAITAEAGEGVDFEEYQRPDPTLPSPPPGDVKRFQVDVYEHVTKVSDDFAPTRVWSFGVNGKLNRGTGVSEPMVVTEGDEVEIELVNGGSEEMNVKFPHSIDFHSSEVAPNVAFASIPPGETHTFSFVAKHPGVFMYHCATDPVLHHTGAGMVGMMVVKPADLPPVDRELWVTQQEYYLGLPGEDPDLAKMEAKDPDVIAFNGYANQYKDNPIAVKRGERIRMWVMNAGPTEWSAFHVIGTVFDRTVIEGTVGRDSQTMNLAPSQGGWAEFTLDAEGTFPFVTHAFGDMVKGAAGVLATEGAPAASGGHDHAAH
jgi:nitrite reductase (NO-forming)